MGDRQLLQRLRVAMEANAAAYRRAVQTSAPGDCWDYLVLTAANEKQAQGYRQELALRHREVGPTGAFFPAIQKSLVVPDPPGKRAGSGGATLGVMRALAAEFALGRQDLCRARILLIHSGGASQRLPAYSPLGKIFAPLPLLRPDGQISTLFDHLYITLAGLPERLGPGMLVVAGDVFLLLDHRHVSAPGDGVTALTMRVEAEMGLGHGVFVTDSRHRIRRTLQKVSVQEMKQRGATDAHGRVLIDTGLLFFDPASTAVLAELAACPAQPSRRPGQGLHETCPGPIDLYEDMTAALASATDRASYLGKEARKKPEARSQNPQARGRKGDATGYWPLVTGCCSMRRRLWNALHGIPFRVMELEGQFLHLGTTRQFRDAMVGQNPSPAAELFQHNVLTHSAWPLADGRRIYHSVLLARDGKTGTIGPGAVVEHSILAGEASIGAGSVVSQVLAVNRPVRLGNNLLLFQVPVRDATREGTKARRHGGTKGGTRQEQLPTACRHLPTVYVHVICGVHDDFKGRYGDGQCVYLNRDIDEFLARHGISPRELWADVPGDQRTLWTARLFVGTRDRDAAGTIAWMGDSACASPRQLAAWRKAPRWSMAMLLEQADPVALIEHREVVSAYLQTSALLDAIAGGLDRPAESYIGHYTTPAAYAACLDLLANWSGAAGDEAQSALRRARAAWAAVTLLQRPDHPDPATARRQVEDLMSSAFAHIAQASEVAHASIEIDRGGAARLRPGLAVEAASPVRLDLCGGWSDTPPYCYERGGHVVNVAIDLDGVAPVRAAVKTIREPKLVLHSHDLGKQVVLTRLAPQERHVQVHDPFALHKVALRMAGLLPEEGQDLAAHLRRLGAGLSISTECRVPKGSGLGTSSILGATLLGALQALAGRPATPQQLIEQTLLLEQRLSTGGGWQDQVGGIVGGVKSTTTAPGLPQRPNVEALDLTDEQYAAIEQRLVVYYSGQQRLARDILRRVMGSWLAREPSVVLLLEELKKSAAALRSALLKSQWTIAARQIGRYWQIKKELFSGSTTPTIDVLLLELREDYLAAGLAGAGGGGFAYFFCRDARQAARLRARLVEVSSRPGSMGTLYEARINRRGLVVTTRTA